MSSPTSPSVERQPGLRRRLGEGLHRASPTLFAMLRFPVWAARVALLTPRGRVALALILGAAAALAVGARVRPDLAAMWLGLAGAAGALALLAAMVAYVRGRLAEGAEALGARLEARRAADHAAHESRLEIHQLRLDTQHLRLAQLESALAELRDRTGRVEARREADLLAQRKFVTKVVERRVAAVAADREALETELRRVVKATVTQRVETAMGKLGGRLDRSEAARAELDRELRRLIADAMTSALDRMAVIEQAAEDEIRTVAGTQSRLAEVVESLRERAEADRTAEEIAALRALIAEASERNAANARTAAELTRMVAERIQAYREDIAALRRAIDELRARPTGTPRAETQRLTARVAELEGKLETNLGALRRLVDEVEQRAGEAARRTAEAQVRDLDATVQARVAEFAQAAEARTTALGETLQGRVAEVARTAEAARAAAAAAGEQVEALAASARDEAQRLTEQAELIAKIGAEAESAAASARQSMDAAARARNAAVDSVKAVEARAAAAEEEARKAGRTGERALKLLSRMGGANAALARPFDRLVSDEAMGRLEGHWTRVLGLNLSRSAIGYLAHQICLAEDRCEGRIAAPIETVLLRLLALRSLQRDSLEILEVGTLFGIAAGVLHRLAGAQATQVRLTLLDPLEGYYRAGATDPVTGAPVERRVLERNLAAMGVPPQDYRILQMRSDDPGAREAAHDRLYDLVILDGDHSTAGVAHDFETFGPLVRPGGLLLFDDYGSEHWPGIKPYVDEHVRNDPDWIWIGGEFRTGILRRKQRERDGGEADAPNVRALRPERGAR